MTKRQLDLSRLCWCALLAACAICALCVPALAQCAMCKATASGLDSRAARYVNIAVVLMVSPPVTIFCGFLYLTYKHRQPPDEKERSVAGE